MDPLKQQKVWSSRWKAKLKADPVRYEAYLEQARARDRARPPRKPKNPKKRDFIMTRVLADTVARKPPDKKSAIRNRPETISKKVSREVYDLNQSGEKINPERVVKLRDRRERNKTEPFAQEIDDALNHMLR